MLQIEEKKRNKNKQKQIESKIPKFLFSFYIKMSQQFYLQTGHSDLMGSYKNPL